MKDNKPVLQLDIDVLVCIIRDMRSMFLLSISDAPSMSEKQTEGLTMYLRNLGFLIKGRYIIYTLRSFMDSSVLIPVGLDYVSDYESISSTICTVEDGQFGCPSSGCMFMIAASAELTHAQYSRFLSILNPHMEVV